MGKITSIVGLVLIVSAGILASVSINYESQIKTKKELSSKYIQNAKEALSRGDKKSATKFIKMALKIDPNNKQIFKLIQELSGVTNTATKPTSISKKTENKTESLESKKEAPVAEEEEEDDGLGC